VRVFLVADMAPANAWKLGEDFQSATFCKQGPRATDVDVAVAMADGVGALVGITAAGTEGVLWCVAVLAQPVSRKTPAMMASEIFVHIPINPCTRRRRVFADDPAGHGG
jgi:hypothetical protein